jgi:predicted regulator of Ras-like GTPase activity (Roadblock/LC7/MglB family)
MTAQIVGSADIFEGAEKIEILGRLPSFLWACIDSARRLTDQVKAGPVENAEVVSDVTRLLSIVESAAVQLGHAQLQALLKKQVEMLEAFKNGTLSGDSFAKSFLDGLPSLEALAGPRRDAPGEGLMDRAILDQQMEKVERIKAGRSSDLVVSMAILDDVKDYLSSEVMTEGISSILVIDNAGTLICDIGGKLALDVISLAAVAAANFAATEQIARLIGERDFVLLFYKGHNESFHFSRVGEEYIIVTIFNNSLSLGLLRLKIAEVAQVLEKKLPKRQV